MQHRNVVSQYIGYVLLLSAVVSTCFAEIPVVALDGNPETSGVSAPPSSVIAGETFLLAVTTSNVINLHSYSVKCHFDSNVVSFNGAVAKLSPFTPAFLESHQGNIAAFLSVPGDGMVEIAATQSGDTISKCAQGEGILGFLSFTAKIKGDPNVHITSATMVDPFGKCTSAEIH